MSDYRAALIVDWKVIYLWYRLKFANMIVSKIARGFLRGNSFFSNQCLLKKSINNSFLARNISVSAFTHAKEHVYVSPCSNVEIPDVSILEYLLSKSKSHDDRIALVSIKFSGHIYFQRMQLSLYIFFSELCRLTMKMVHCFIWRLKITVSVYTFINIVFNNKYRSPKAEAIFVLNDPNEMLWP